VPERWIQRRSDGPASMRRAADGWCAALDRTSRRCSIYSIRPAACRRFVMGGNYCISVREEFHRTPHALALPDPSTHGNPDADETW
jgi:Fe-S-cluster containining protein